MAARKPTEELATRLDSHLAAAFGQSPEDEPNSAPLPTERPRAREQTEKTPTGKGGWGQAVRGRLSLVQKLTKDATTLAAKGKKTDNGVTAPSAAERVPVVVQPLKEQIVAFNLRGMAPYMQLRFSQKAMAKMQATQEAGSQSRSKVKREARDFTQDYEQAMHLLEDGSHGIPAAAFRNAMISACRTIGFKMTLAKLSIFVEPDGLDQVDGTPLVRLYGEPEQTVMPVRNATGVADLRVRPLWREWYTTIRVRFDTAQFSVEDVFNLVIRAGAQVGIGEGRPDSRESAGLGYGLFTIDANEEA